MGKDLKMDTMNVQLRGEKFNVNPSEKSPTFMLWDAWMFLQNASGVFFPWGESNTIHGMKEEPSAPKNW